MSESSEEKMSGRLDYLGSLEDDGLGPQQDLRHLRRRRRRPKHWKIDGGGDDEGEKVIVASDGTDLTKSYDGSADVSCPGNLTTSLLFDKGVSGNMFNVQTGWNQVFINGFDIISNSTQVDYMVFTRSESFEAGLFSIDGWTLVAREAAESLNGVIPIRWIYPVAVDELSVQAFYITFVTGALGYLDIEKTEFKDLSPGEALVSNKNLFISLGVGVTYPLNDDSTIQPVLFSGTLYYISSGHCPVDSAQSARERMAPRQAPSPSLPVPPEDNLDTPDTLDNPPASAPNQPQSPVFDVGAAASSPVEIPAQEGIPTKNPSAVSEAPVSAPNLQQSPSLAQTESPSGEMSQEEVPTKSPVGLNESPVSAPSIQQLPSLAETESPSAEMSQEEVPTKSPVGLNESPVSAPIIQQSPNLAETESPSPDMSQEEMPTKSPVVLNESPVLAPSIPQSPSLAETESPSAEMSQEEVPTKSPVGLNESPVSAPSIQQSPSLVITEPSSKTPSVSLCVLVPEACEPSVSPSVGESSSTPFPTGFSTASAVPSPAILPTSSSPSTLGPGINPTICAVLPGLCAQTPTSAPNVIDSTSVPSAIETQSPTRSLPNITTPSIEQSPGPSLVPISSLAPSSEAGLSDSPHLQTNSLAPTSGTSQTDFPSLQSASFAPTSATSILQSVFPTIQINSLAPVDDVQTPTVAPAAVSSPAPTQPTVCQLLPQLCEPFPSDQTGSPTIESTITLSPSTSQALPSASHPPSTSGAPTNVPSESMVSTQTIAPSLNPSTSPSPTESSVPSSPPSRVASNSPTYSPNPTQSAHPSNIPTKTPLPSETSTPSGFPSRFPPDSPSASVVPTMSEHPSVEPTITPSPSYTMNPTSLPGNFPSIIPSSTPKPTRSSAPSAEPTTSPWPSNSLAPTSLPSRSLEPTELATEAPSTSSEPSAPSVSAGPSLNPSTTLAPTTSLKPSVTLRPTELPLSQMPSETFPPTVSMSPSTFPSGSHMPSMSPLPSVSVAPSLSFSPTQFPTKTPAPTLTATPSDISTADDFPSDVNSSISPAPASISPAETPTGSPNLQIWTRSCITFTMGTETEDLIVHNISFSYSVQTSDYGIDFLSDLELLLLGSVSGKVLVCGDSRSRHLQAESRPRIVSVGYPGETGFSEITSCTPTEPAAQSCWTVDSSFVVIAGQEDEGSQVNQVVRTAVAEVFADTEAIQTAVPSAIVYNFVESQAPVPSPTSEQVSGGGLSLPIAIAAAIVGFAVVLTISYFIFRRYRKKMVKGDDEAPSLHFVPVDQIATEAEDLLGKPETPYAMPQSLPYGSFGFAGLAPHHQSYYGETAMTESDSDDHEDPLETHQMTPLLPNGEERLSGSVEAMVQMFEDGDAESSDKQIEPTNQQVEVEIGQRPEESAEDNVKNEEGIEKLVISQEGISGVIDPRTAQSVSSEITDTQNYKGGEMTRFEDVISIPSLFDDQEAMIAVKTAARAAEYAKFSAVVTDKVLLRCCVFLPVLTKVLLRHFDLGFALTASFAINEAEFDVNDVPSIEISQGHEGSQEDASRLGGVPTSGVPHDDLEEAEVGFLDEEEEGEITSRQDLSSDKDSRRASEDSARTTEEDERFPEEEVVRDESQPEPEDDVYRSVEPDNSSDDSHEGSEPPVQVEQNEGLHGSDHDASEGGSYADESPIGSEHPVAEVPGGDEPDSGDIHVDDEDGNYSSLGDGENDQDVATQSFSVDGHAATRGIQPSSGDIEEGSGMQVPNMRPDEDGGYGHYYEHDDDGVHVGDEEHGDYDDEEEHGHYSDEDGYQAHEADVVPHSDDSEGRGGDSYGSSGMNDGDPQDSSPYVFSRHVEYQDRYHDQEEYEDDEEDPSHHDDDEHYLPESDLRRNYDDSDGHNGDGYDSSGVQNDDVSGMRDRRRYYEEDDEHGYPPRDGGTYDDEYDDGGQEEDYDDSNYMQEPGLRNQYDESEAREGDSYRYESSGRHDDEISHEDRGSE